MSFKKNNEGRVFFQTHERGRGSSALPAQQSRMAQKSASTKSETVGNTQIVGLLRALNEKLQTSQLERKQMRKELDYYRRSLEQISSAKSATPQDTIQELEEARRLILQIEKKADRADQGMSALKTQMVQSLQQQSEFSKTLEDTKSEQAKITRQVNKALEDRSRFMRKIERIEEAVLQTQDALSAKAMVLLTDQGVSGADNPLDMDEKGKIISGDIHAPRETTAHTASAQDLSFVERWKQSPFLNPAATAMVLLLAALLGWSISNIQPQNQTPIEVSEHAPESRLADISQSSERSVQIADSPSEQVREPFYNDFELNRQATASEQEPNIDDIGAVNLQDDTQVLELLESDPDALASQLNALEPSVEENVEIAALPENSQPVQTSPQPIVKNSKPLNAKALEEQIKRDPNLPEVIQDIQNQAFQSIPEAQHDLAAIYTAGHGGVKQDYDRAAFWFEQAASQNIANAAYNLGVLYHQGLGKDKDIGKAIDWYTKAADLGHPEAQYNLGIAFIEGIGVPYDPAKASRYFENAASQDVTEASYNLGLIYENGLLGEPKPDEALMWYKAAADKGSPEAKEALGQLAKSLNIGIDEVNRIAESMKTLKKTNVSSQPTKIKAVAPKPAAVKEAQKKTGGNQAILAQIQELLMDSGLYPGPANGLSSPITRDAIRAYQEQNNLGVTGIADTDLLSHMRATINKNEYGSRE